MVKTLEPYIKKAFSDLGFSDDEIKNGCWLLEKAFKKGEEKKPIAWIAYHKFLERVADKAGIIFEKPEVMNCQEYEIAIYVNGKSGNKSAWSIGEASLKNCTNDYRWAMAEKRAKDRVILKLLGVAGDMYSEEEADEFKRLDEQQETEQEIRKLKNEIKAEKTKDTKDFNKKVEEYNKSVEGVTLRFKTAYEYIKKIDKLDPYKRDEKILKRIDSLFNDLKDCNLESEYQALYELVNLKMPQEVQDAIPEDICENGIEPKEYLTSG